MLSLFIIAVIAVVVILVILWAAGVFKKKQPNALRLRQNFREKVGGKVGGIGYIFNNVPPGQPGYIQDFWGSNNPGIIQVVGIGGLSMLGMAIDARSTNLLNPGTQPALTQIFNALNLITDNGVCAGWNSTSSRNLTNTYSKNVTDFQKSMSDNFGLSASLLLSSIDTSMTASSTIKGESSQTTDTSTYITNYIEQTGSLNYAGDTGSSKSYNPYCFTDNLTSMAIFEALFFGLTNCAFDDLTCGAPDIWFRDSNGGVGPLNTGQLNDLSTYVYNIYGTHIITTITLGSKYNLINQSSTNTTMDQKSFDLNMCINAGMEKPPVCPGTKMCLTCVQGSVCDPDDGTCKTDQCIGVKCAQTYQTCQSVDGSCPVDPDKCSKDQSCMTDPTCDAACAAAIAEKKLCDISDQLSVCNDFTQSDYSQGINTQITTNSFITGGSQAAIDQMTTDGQLNVPGTIPMSTVITFLDSAQDPKNQVAVGYILKPITDVLTEIINSIFDRNSFGALYPADQNPKTQRFLLLGQAWWEQAIMLLKLQYVQSTICPGTQSSAGSRVPFMWLDCAAKDAGGNCAGSPAYKQSTGSAGSINYQCFTRSGEGCTDIYGGVDCSWSGYHAMCVNKGSGLHQTPSLYACDPNSKGKQPLTYGVPDQDAGWQNGCYLSGVECDCSESGNDVAVIWDTSGSYDCM